MMIIIDIEIDMFVWPNSFFTGFLLRNTPEMPVPVAWRNSSKGHSSVSESPEAAAGRGVGGPRSPDWASWNDMVNDT